MYWYYDEINRLEAKNVFYDHPMIFYGSSTITLWESLEEEFKEFEALNYGFGGSTIASCLWFFERVFSNLNPSSIVIYAGDNDLGDQRHPEEVYMFTLELLRRIRMKFGSIPVFYISIKPSPQRNHLLKSIDFTNSLIKSTQSEDDKFIFIDIFNHFLIDENTVNGSYFDNSGLHLNKSGYDLLSNIILENLHQYFTNNLE